MRVVQEIDPLHDPRWPELLGRHPAASIFHTPGWLKALKHTYGYQPAVLTTSGPDTKLTNGLVFCRVQSWITGRRLVSLPFSDFCEPLLETIGGRSPWTAPGPLTRPTLESLLDGFASLTQAEHCKYAELRPVSPLELDPPAFQATQSFHHHKLDLRPGAAELYRHFHKDCIQRKIRRAEREGLLVTAEKHLEALTRFYGLLLLTRRRHGVPPQPLAWFTNLLDCLGDSVTIRLASKGDQPIAGILTIQHGGTLYYKYGASDARFHNLGAMPLLFWQAIQDAISRGLEVFDLGRSDCGNEGLADFKERLGATRSSLTYWRSPAQQPVSSEAWKLRLMHHACAHIPDRCLTMLGALLYRHIG
jgi:CelD/BcsL family acetyltransferase involved in cellulose biosynthesis